MRASLFSDRADSFFFAAISLAPSPWYGVKQLDLLDLERRLPKPTARADAGACSQHLTP
jgi:hypothetical protein